MIDVVWQSIGAILLLAGIVGCVVPVMPGPVLAFCGMLCLLPTQTCPTTTELCLYGGVTVVAIILDYVVPMLGAKVFRCSRAGTIGCFLGTIVGCFFFPLGLLLGPFLGAFAGELVSGRSVYGAVGGGFGALLGFLAGTALKVMVCLVMAYAFVHAVWGIGPALFPG